MHYVECMKTSPLAEGLRSGGKPPKDKSIRNKVGVLSQVLRSAKARHIIPTNPARDLDWHELLSIEEQYHRQYRL